LKINLVFETDIEKAKKEIKNSKRPLIIVAQDEKFNRKIIEFGGFDILLSPEKRAGKSKLKKEISGFNHILARIATKNKIALGIDLEEIKKLNREEKAKRLSRIKQNISVCKKAGTKIKVLGNKKEIQSFLLSLGASTIQAKEAIAF